MNQHEPYEKRSDRTPDFEVEYEFTLDDEFGFVQEPYQGMRSDFLYDGADPQKDGISMIQPEFLDEKGNVIKNKENEIQLKGYAFMWILMDESRQNIHRKRN